MATFDIGDVVTLDFTVSVGGTPTDPTAVTLTVTQPDGTTSSPSPTHVSAGVYSGDFVPTQGGEHAYLWKATGVAQAAEGGVFFVDSAPTGAPGSPFATAADVAARWRALTVDEQNIANVLATDASALIRARFPGIDSSVASGSVDATLVRMVVAGMVKRALIAPNDGVSQESEGIGPYSHSQTYANPMRNVFLTAADLTLLLGYQPTATSGTFGNTTQQYNLPNQTVYGW